MAKREAKPSDMPKRYTSGQVSVQNRLAWREEKKFLMKIDATEKTIFLFNLFIIHSARGENTEILIQLQFESLPTFMK